MGGYCGRADLSLTFCSLVPEGRGSEGVGGRARDLTFWYVRYTVWACARATQQFSRSEDITSIVCGLTVIIVSAVKIGRDPEGIFPRLKKVSPEGNAWGQAIYSKQWIT